MQTLINIDNKKIIYWRDIPIDVEIGMFSYYEKYCTNKLVIICQKDFDNARKKSNWNKNEINNSTKIFIKNMDHANSLIDKFKNDINIFFGITGVNHSIIEMLIKINPHAKFFIVAERPNVYGNFLTKKIRYITRYTYYSIMAKRYQKFLLGYFCIGKYGIKTYKSYGWSQKKLFNYMYTLNQHPNYKKVLKTDPSKIKVLYIGRFLFKTKGLDLIIKAMNKAKYNNLFLDLVGGYGKDLRKVMKMIEPNKNINYLGQWKNEELFEKINNYDICIAPSRYDGWNLTPNLAIDSCIGTITTAEATSGELIKCSGAGVVLDKARVKDLKNLLEEIALKAPLIDSWKENAKEYKEKINNEKICSYFINVINYCYNDYYGKRPEEPWKN